MDKKPEISKLNFGLIGKDIDYFFSKGYFTQKFDDKGLPYNYENYHLNNIDEFPACVESIPNLTGLNVTIPYKEAVIPFLDKLSSKARTIGAVNTIKPSRKGKLKGYNTDYYGFKKSLKPLLQPKHTRALILGTGGASKAIVQVLKDLGIEFNMVSRTKNKNARFTYSQLTLEDVASHQLIINCTPLGTYPETDAFPDIPYQGVSESHLLYDLVYNPPLTRFLQLGKEKGAQITNGLKMLELQAEKAWRIWMK